VLVPPRAFSDQTLEPTADWVEVGPGGRIETFTMVYEEFNGLVKVHHALRARLLPHAPGMVLAVADGHAPPAVG